MEMTPKEIYDKFKKQSGSNSIAGLATLTAVLDEVRSGNPKNVLEMGGGIGTISYAVLNNSSAFIDIYEHDDFCRGILKENLRGMEDRYSLITDYLRLPPKRSYDLIVVDGGAGGGSGYDGGFDQAIGSYIQSLKNLKTIIVEGQRKSQKYWILKALRPNYVYKVTVYPDPSGGKKIGTRFDCKKSPSELMRLLNHFYQRKKIF